MAEAMVSLSLFVELAFEEWIKSLDLKKKTEILDFIKDFCRLAHLKEYDVKEDLDSLVLKKAEKRRFVSNVVCSYALQQRKSYGCPSKLGMLSHT